MSGWKPAFYFLGVACALSTFSSAVRGQSCTNPVTGTVTCTGGAGSHVTDTNDGAIITNWPTVAAQTGFGTTINVTGGGAAVKTVSITLHGYTSEFSGDFFGSAEMGLMLVSPNNHNLEVLRCPGNTNGGESNLTITLADSGTTIQNCQSATSAWTSGTWKPGSYPSEENEPNYTQAGAPALAHSAASNGTSTMNSVGGVFTGDTINGAWKLYLVSDAFFETDVQFSSWDITITYTAASVPTTTSLSPSSSTAFTSSPNNSVTLTATVSGSGGPPTGTVQFQNGSSTIAGCGSQALSGGAAHCTATFTTEGLQSLSATYSGDGTFETSSGTAGVFTYNHSTNSGNTYCNSGTISGTNAAATLPYPSVVDVTGLSGESVDTVSVTLQNFSTSDANGLHMLLVSPDGSHTLDFWGEAGGGAASAGSYTLEDGAGSVPNSPISPGTYSPTANFTTDNFALGTPIGAPAPQPPGTFSLAGPAGTKTFETSMLGATATGNWLLYVDNEGTTQTPTTTASLGGWCVDITPSSGFATTVTLSSIPTTYATKGSSVTFIATVTSPGHGTVNEGTVTFTENDVPLAGAPNSGVASVSGGSATISTSGLAEGDHTVTATYHDSAGTYNDNIGTESLRVDAATPTATLSGTTWTYCNTAGITIPAGTIFTNDTGPAGPNPSNVFVTNLFGTVKTVTLTIDSFSVTFPGDLESLLVGPNGSSAPGTGQTLDFFSLTGGTVGTNFDHTTTFSDSFSPVLAGGPVGTQVAPTSRGATSYTASPFYTLPGTVQHATTQGNFTFDTGGTPVYVNTIPNGTWSLYFDQTTHHVGDGASGWCVNLTDNNVTGAVSESHIGPAPSNNFVQGGTGQLTTAITNDGTGLTGDPDGNHALTVTDTLDSALSYASSSGTDWICSPSGQVVTCVNHDPIAQGSSYPTLTINVTVSASATSPVSNSVGVSGGGMTTTSGSDSINIDPSPLLSVTKSHTGTFTQGSTAVWDITVNNTAANSDTTGPTTVLDALPTGYTLSSYTGTGWTCTGTTTVSCTSSQVVAGGSSFNTIHLTVNIPATSPTTVTNTADAYGGGDKTHTMVGNAATGTDSNVPVVQVPASVTITAGGTQSAGINTAFGTALTVVVKDAAGVTIPSYSPVTFTAPSSGASGTFSNTTNTIGGTTNGSGVVSETFTANGTAGGPYSVTAVAGSVSASPAFMLTNTSTPSLSVTKTHTGTFTQGQTAEWDITINNTVTNTSTSGATNVSDALPTGYTLSSYTASGWSCSGSTTVTCTSSQVVSGGSSFNKIQLFVNVPGASPTSVSNTALAWGGGDLTHTNSGNAASGTDSNVAVVQVPASVTITAGGTQSAGINTAFGTALTVVVKDAAGVTIPSYSPVTFTAPATGASGTFSNTTNTINGTTNGSGVVSETFTANGTAGGPYSVTAVAGSASASPAFMLTNTTTPSLSVTKSHTGTFTQGQTAEWDITVNNTVTNTSTSGTTSVSDVLPSGYTLSSYTASGWSCGGSTTVTCTSSQVVAGGSSFVKIQLFVNVPGASPTAVSNTALAWGGGDLTHTNSGNAASGTDANVPVVQVPASVTITAGGTQSATINTAFGTALTVVVKDAGGVTIPSYTPVTFTAPSTGASGAFSNTTNTINGTTNGSGVVSETFTANGTAGGPYSVTVTAGSASASPPFMLTNTTVASDALILSVSPGGSGSAGANPANSTGLTAGNYTPGAVVTLTATPAAGYVFSNWSGSADLSSTSANPTTITMNASTENVTANFVLASTNVTSGVSVTSTGLVYNRVTKQGTETVTITNTSGSPIAGPVQLVISGLPGTVTPVGNTGTFSGNPYWTATAGSLATGSSVKVTIAFSYAIGTSFSTSESVYSGSLP